jgi:hypothetical protein
MEYASMTILTNSQYGKSNNSNYLDGHNYTFKKVYPNSYMYNVTGCSSEYNIYSKSFSMTTSKTCIPYNDLNNYTHISNSINYPIGLVGPGASTTGTIYGVYDMANIEGELVSGISLPLDGVNTLNAKYYDVYSYNDYIGKINSSSSVSNLYRYKLGDAIEENMRSMTDKGMWQDGIIEHQANGVILRGGNGKISNSSIYTTTFVDVKYEAPFRASIFVK